MIYGKPLELNTNSLWICNQIGVTTPEQLIVEAAIKSMHRVINTQKPPHIFNQIVFQRNFRLAANLSTIHNPRTVRCRRSLFYKSLRQFNNLKPNLKYCHPKQFKKIIEKRDILEVPDN